MKNKPPGIFENIVPFLVLGMVFALLLGFLFLFSYVLVWGFIIGVILWIVTVIKNYFFADKSINSTPTTIKKSKGRIIEHEENNPKK